MRKYIGTKMIEAEAAIRVDGVMQPVDWPIPAGSVVEYGYRVRYADGYESFSPAHVFEKAYLPLKTNDELRTDAPSISQEMVDDFIKSIDVFTVGDKTTVVRAVLVNGFEIVESSSCVSAENYDEKMGTGICLEKIKDKIWNLLGFLLQTAVHGVLRWEEEPVEKDMAPQENSGEKDFPHILIWKKDDEYGVDLPADMSTAYALDMILLALAQHTAAQDNEMGFPVGSTLGLLFMQSAKRLEMKI